MHVIIFSFSPFFLSYKSCPHFPFCPQGTPPTPAPDQVSVQVQPVTSVRRVQPPRGFVHVQRQPRFPGRRCQPHTYSEEGEVRRAGGVHYGRLPGPSAWLSVLLFSSACLSDWLFVSISVCLPVCLFFTAVCLPLNVYLLLC